MYAATLSPGAKFTLGPPSLLSLSMVTILAASEYALARFVDEDDVARCVGLAWASRLANMVFSLLAVVSDTLPI